MVIGITEKLRKKLRLSYEKDIVSTKGDINCWHGHYFPWNRKACVIFVNNLTRYCVVLYGIKASDMESIDEMFREQLRRNFILDNIDIGSGEEYIDGLGKIEFSKTSDRSILGSINDFFICISWRMDEHIGPFGIDLDGLNKVANDNISLALHKIGLPSTLSYAMKEMLEGKKNGI